MPAAIASSTLLSWQYFRAMSASLIASASVAERLVPATLLVVTAAAAGSGSIFSLCAGRPEMGRPVVVAERRRAQRGPSGASVVAGTSWFMLPSRTRRRLVWMAWLWLGDDRRSP